MVGASLLLRSARVNSTSDLSHHASRGTPAQPQCGFSMQVVRVLHAEGVEFDAVNVLEDAAIREGVKSFSEWPTIPQLYVDGEFLGGCDVVTNMHQEGELNTTLVEAGCLND